VSVVASRSFRAGVRLHCGVLTRLRDSVTASGLFVFRLNVLVLVFQRLLWFGCRIILVARLWCRLSRWLRVLKLRPSLREVVDALLAKEAVAIRAIESNQHFPATL
jgi:hypothetical protein